MTHTEILTDIGLSPTVDEISPAAYGAAKKMLLDALGCALAARSSPGVPEVVEQMRDWGGKPEATLLLYGDRVPAPNAVFANSTLIHALDYDDVYIPGSLHLTSIIVPATLAAAEMSKASGKAALAAMIAGTEVAARLGIAGRNRRRSGAFLPSSLDGGFGAVVTAARLLGLTREQCVDAMGINYAQVSGNRQALHDMTLTKRIQPAFAARSAMWAVALAHRGVTGPPRALEGSAGLFSAYMDGDVPDADELTVAKDWFEIENVSVKPYTSCGACHSAQAAAEILIAEERLKSEEIERVELFGCGPGGLVGNPFRIGRNPQVDAQFSVAYGVALALLRGPAKLDHFTDEAILADTEVADLAASIVFVETPEDVPESLTEPPADFGAYTSRPHGLIVHTRDGRRLIRARSPAQTFEARTVEFDDVVPKFRDCARFSGVCDAARTDGIIEEVSALDARSSITRLMGLLCP
jgi:2-methylcitrate dehydratase PrpD